METVTVTLNQSAFLPPGMISLNSKKCFFAGLALAIACGLSSRVDAGFKAFPSTSLVLYSASPSASDAVPQINMGRSTMSGDGLMLGSLHTDLNAMDLKGAKPVSEFNLSNSEVFANFEGWRFNTPSLQATSVEPRPNPIVPLLIPLPTAVTSGVCGLLAIAAMVMPRRMRRRIFS